MIGKILNYYAGGNTGKGYVNLIQSNIMGLEQLYILIGGSRASKSELMKKLATEWGQNGVIVEIIHCSSNNHAIDGVIIPQLKVGIIDGASPHINETFPPRIKREFINLDACRETELLRNKAAIINIENSIRAAFQTAYSVFSEALKEHDELEEIYIKNMDFDKANALTMELIEKIFTNKRLEKKAVVRHRFLGAATPNGPVDFIMNLTEGLKKRYFIKGRAGTGKSTLLKKLASVSEERGFDTEIYHCGFDPNSLDMVIIRELGVAIFDSTDPHEYFPDRDGDEIVDMYLVAIPPGTDEKYAIEINDVQKRYKDKMKEGTCYLAQAKAFNDELEAYYHNTVDDSIIKEIYQTINNGIKKFEK